MKHLFMILTCLIIFFLYGCGKNDSDNGINDNPNISTIEVLSFNLRSATSNDGDNNWENRKDGAVKVILTEQPDFFGVQEGRSNQVQYFQSKLSDYTRISYANTESEPNTIFFHTADYTLLSSGMFWLSETPNVSSKFKDSNNLRTANFIKLRHKKTNQIIYYFNTHFDHIGTIARTESSKLMVKKIKEIAGDDAIVFLSGDFNSKSTDSYLTTLNEYMKLSRTAAPITDNHNTYNGWGTAASTTIIDHIYFRNATASLYHTITENFGVPYVSDHYPIKAVFTIFAK